MFLEVLVIVSGGLNVALALVLISFTRYHRKEIRRVGERTEEMMMRGLARAVHDTFGAGALGQWLQRIQDGEIKTH